MKKELKKDSGKKKPSKNERIAKLVKGPSRKTFCLKCGKPIPEQWDRLEITFEDGRMFSACKRECGDSLMSGKIPISAVKP